MGIRDLVTPPLQPSMGVGAGGGCTEGAFVSLEKRGRLPSPDSPPGAAPLLAAAPPQAG